jgi:hypothetical protein
MFSPHSVEGIITIFTLTYTFSMRKLENGTILYYYKIGPRLYNMREYVSCKSKPGISPLQV